VSLLSVIVLMANIGLGLQTTIKKVAHGKKQTTSPWESTSRSVSLTFRLKIGFQPPFYSFPILSGSVSPFASQIVIFIQFDHIDYFML